MNMKRRSTSSSGPPCLLSKVCFLTGRLTDTLKQDLAKHNSQYPPITVIQNKNIHDRFLIVDEDVYHIGASLKDLGKKLFAFSKMEISPSVLTAEGS